MEKSTRMTSSELQKLLIQQSSLVFHSYFDRNMDCFISMLDPDFVWIGSYDFQYTKGIEQFLEITKQEQNEISAKVFDEEYHILSHTENTWIVYGRFSSSAWKDESTYLYTRQRATFVWKYTGKSFKLLHLHCTMARDIPLEGSSPISASKRLELRWYEYMQNAELNRHTDEDHLLLKDTNGIIHYLEPSEIIHIHMNYRIATVYTLDSTFDMRKNLNQLLETLPFLVQIHKSRLVNPLYVLEIRRYFLKLSNNEEIPVGKARYNEVRKLLKNI